MKTLNSVVILFAILGVIGVGLFFYPGSPFYYKTIIITQEAAPVETTENTLEEASENTEETSSISDVDMVAPEENNEEMAQENAPELDIAADETTPETSDGINFDVKDMSIGSDEAPITVYEYSSLSCGHCGNFHSEIYPEIKSNYIETGKVKLVMIDFPLNLPAMQGAMLAHCLPDDQYFNFLQLLFTTQQSWLTGDYEANLKQNAQLAGMTMDEIESCLANSELEEKLLARMEEAQAKWNVSSTPSFVINNGDEIIEGNRPYSFFVETFNEMLNNTNATDE